jgi:hypothetical protein
MLRRAARIPLMISSCIVGSKGATAKRVTLGVPGAPLMHGGVGALQILVMSDNPRLGGDDKLVRVKRVSMR